MGIIHLFCTYLLLCYVCLASSDESSTDSTSMESSIPAAETELNPEQTIPQDINESDQSMPENQTTPPENTTNMTTTKFIHCSAKIGTNEVQLVNDTELIKLLLPDPKITSRDQPATCVLVLFYSKYCPFSSMAAPHFNAMPRAFPDIKMVAINAIVYHLFNTQNGIVGVPSLLLFHNGRPVAKFNDTEYTLDLFSKFITKYTGITPEEKSTVTSADFSGPVTSLPNKDSDIFLMISWLFILFCIGYYFTKSSWWTWIIETVQSNWRESAHQHVD